MGQDDTPAGQCGDTSPSKERAVLDFSNLTHESLAGYLLQSSDPAVQSAAKRIFSITQEDDHKDDETQQSVEEDPNEVSSSVAQLLSSMATRTGEKGGSQQGQQKQTMTTKTEDTRNEVAPHSPPTQSTPARTGSTIADLIACSGGMKMGKKGPGSGADKVQSRERNRMHARKTRQRKKEHMANLQNRAEELKQEQIRLRQAINEQNTASILLVMFGRNGSSCTPALSSSSQENKEGTGSSRVEELLRRPVSDIPDSSKISDLPALVYPSSAASGEKMNIENPNDGIDYELLSKDRTKCTPDELDRIRKERNRMHAKRTRDRKRIYMEEMEGIIKTLEDENKLLLDHHHKLAEDLNAQKGVRVNPVSADSSSGASLCGDDESSVNRPVPEGEEPSPKKQRIEQPAIASVATKIAEPEPHVVKTERKVNADKTEQESRMEQAKQPEKIVPMHSTNNVVAV